jgi:hypothetical protein
VGDHGLRTLISAVDTTVHRLCCFSVQLSTAFAYFSVEAQGFSPAIQHPKNPASAAWSIHIGRAR